ncbi:MAG: helix-turn-helix transcriptional regulator [Clostridia bacterium]|nr:helix-turn-helix transcriptional regulator [Clostridia bacterium]
MFKDNFEKICIQKNVAPTAVCKKIGLSAAAYSKWTGESIPRKTTLIKIANELGVTIEELLEEKKLAEKGNRLQGVDLLTDSQVKIVQALINSLIEQNSNI